MVDRISVLIADDHALIRKGLRQVLEIEQQFDVQEAVDGKEALESVRHSPAEITILDIQMPHYTGFEVAERIHREGINTSVIFLTMHRDEQLFNKAMNIGVMGFVLKENTVTEITRCIETVLAGKHYLSPEISEFLIRRNSMLMANASDQKGISQLTATEKKVLIELATMKTSQEIADHFGVSIKTVQNHRSNICSKLGISGHHALLKFAIEHANYI
ncbi:MAG: response regulator transcription factor [Balneolaceae bacterium]|nr:response regulator transcription factor [Balneolaceae bacterium]